MHEKPEFEDLIEKFDQYLKNNKGGIIDHPIRYIEDHKLKRFLEPLHAQLRDLVTLEELERGAKLAKSECEPHLYFSPSWTS